MKTALGLGIVGFLAISLAACGNPDSELGNQSPTQLPEQTSDSARKCPAFTQAIDLVNHPLTQYEQGVFYAYYCK